MTNLIQTKCESCGSLVEIPYILLGAPAHCEFCDKTVMPYVPVGTVYPNTAKETSFQDFHQLISNKFCRKQISKLFNDWFNYSFRESDGNIKIVDKNQKEVDKILLHKNIQNNKNKQEKIYQIAMSLWR